MNAQNTNGNGRRSQYCTGCQLAAGLAVLVPLIASQAFGQDCANFTSCFECVRTYPCGWCPEEGGCFRGTEEGPNGFLCDTWKWDAAACAGVIADVDSDGDGLPDDIDPNPTEDDFADSDGDGIRDVEDPYPHIDNSLDSDRDGEPNITDPTPFGGETPYPDPATPVDDDSDSGDSPDEDDACPDCVRPPEGCDYCGNCSSAMMPAGLAAGFVSGWRRKRRRQSVRPQR